MRLKMNASKEVQTNRFGLEYFVDPEKKESYFFELESVKVGPQLLWEDVLMEFEYPFPAFGPVAV